MSDDEQALLAAILAHPEEDTPRLVYADYLDERGRAGDRECAEFIRVQVHLAIPVVHVDVRRPSVSLVCNACIERELMKDRERELFAIDDAGGWNGFLLNGPDRNVFERMEEEPIWRRGFVDELHAGADDCDMPRVLQFLPDYPVTRLTCTVPGWLGNCAELCESRSLRHATLTGWLPSVLHITQEAAPGESWRHWRFCTFLGRTKRHRVALVNATADEYRAICEAEWPGIAFTLPAA